jgi:integrase
MNNILAKSNQKATPDNLGLVVIPKNAPDGLGIWAQWYFDHAVTTMERSRKEQHRDLALFLKFMELNEKIDARPKWTPQLSEEFKEHLRKALDENGSRQWSDRTINRVVTHLKTFAKWVHGLRPFPLGNPMSRIKAIPVTNSLEIERALTTGERRRLLNASDLLLPIGGLSKSRRRCAGEKERPRRKGYRPYRNRAIIYTLIETCMRRRAVMAVNILDVDSDKRKITVEEKGGMRYAYQISREGVAAILDYVQKERGIDDEKWNSPAVFLSPCTNPHGNGRLTVKVINQI